MNKLVKLKESLDHQDGGGGKLWLSLNKQSTYYKYLLQHCLRVVIEAPKVNTHVPYMYIHVHVSIIYVYIHVYVSLTIHLHVHNV